MWATYLLQNVNQSIQNDSLADFESRMSRVAEKGPEFIKTSQEKALKTINEEINKDAEGKKCFQPGCWKNISDSARVQPKCDRKDLKADLNEKELKIHFQESLKTRTFPQGQTAFNIKIVPKLQNMFPL